MLSVVVTDISTTWVEIIIRITWLWWWLSLRLLKSQSLDSDDNFHSGCWKVKRSVTWLWWWFPLGLLKGQLLDSDNDFCSDCPKVSHLTLMMTSRKHHFRYCLSISNLNGSQNQERTKQKIFLNAGKHLGNSTLLLSTSDRTSSLQNSVSSSINNFF